MAAHKSQPPRDPPALLPKRLLHIVASFAPAAGGTTEGIRKLAESCAGISAMELVCLDDPAESYVLGQSFPVHALGPARGNYRYTPRLREWLRQNLSRFDGVVIHGLWQYHSYGSYRLIRGRTPYVVFPHGMLDPYFKRAFPLKHLKKQLYWLAREYRVLRDARAVCFTTPIERDSAAGTLWPQRWNPVVVSFGTSEPAGDRGDAAGDLFWRGILLCASAGFFSSSPASTARRDATGYGGPGRVAAAHPDLDLVMAGPDEEGLRPQLEAQAKRLQIAHRVHWTGMLQGDLKWGAFHAADAFVLPSHQENFGVAVVEALACGVPVLISDKVNIWPDILQR